ncbi:hypothetical protein C8Q72DRAFT_950311 [Fomitopsis betulina]|nr:hypothetical protein C8Q72DRAFT_950311 [Fomitopsis betulina]
MRYATITLALASAAAVAPSLARPVQARSDIDLYARDFGTELVARAKGGHGRPKPVGSGPNKPSQESFRERDLESLFAREFDELVARAKPSHGEGSKGGPKSGGSGPNKPREFDDELVARAKGSHGLGGLGGPKPGGSGPNKPSHESFRERDLESLFAREFDELVARAKPSHGQGGKGGPKSGGSGPNKPREFYDDLWERMDMDDLE